MTNGSEGARLGFAWAGSLDEEVIDSAVEEARDNARFATPDPDVIFATPDGVAPSELDLWDPSVADIATDDKVALALDLERQVRADPRIRQVDSADYGDERIEVALASTTGIRAFTQRTSAFLSVSAIAGEGADTHTGTGFSVARGFSGPGRRPRCHGRDRSIHPDAWCDQGARRIASPSCSTRESSQPCSR